MFGKHTNDFTLKWPCQFMEMHSKPKSRVAHIMNWLSTHFNTMYPVDSSFEFPCFFPLHTWLVRTILDLLPLTWLKWVLVINIFGALVKHGKFLRKKNTKCTMQFHFHHCSNGNSAQEQDENSIHKSTMNLLSNVIHGRDSLFAVRKCKTCFQLSKKEEFSAFVEIEQLKGSTGGVGAVWERVHSEEVDGKTMIIYGNLIHLTPYLVMVACRRWCQHICWELSEIQVSSLDGIESYGKWAILNEQCTIKVWCLFECTLISHQKVIWNTFRYNFAYVIVTDNIFNIFQSLAPFLKQRIPMGNKQSHAFVVWNSPFAQDP